LGTDSIECGDTKVVMSFELGIATCDVDEGGDLGTKIITCAPGAHVVISDGTQCSSPANGVYVCGPITVVLEGDSITCTGSPASPFSASCSSS